MVSSKKETSSETKPCLSRKRKMITIAFGLIILLFSFVSFIAASDSYISPESSIRWTNAGIVIGIFGFLLTFQELTRWGWNLIRIMIHDAFYEASRGIKNAKETKTRKD